MWERFNPFPHTTILQQTTLNIFCQKIENLFNWMDNLWLKAENIVAKGEIERFVTMFSKSCLLQRHQKVPIWGKGLNTCLTLIVKFIFVSIYHRIFVKIEIGNVWFHYLVINTTIHTSSVSWFINWTRFTTGFLIIYWNCIRNKRYMPDFYSLCVIKFEHFCYVRALNKSAARESYSCLVFFPQS